MANKTMSKSGGLWAKVGVWSYIAGLVIALLVSIFSTAGLAAWAVVVLAVLGLIVGLINISDSEVSLYLLATIAFVVAAGSMSTVFGALGSPFATLQQFMYAIIVFTAPGALVVSFKALYQIAKDE